MTLTQRFTNVLRRYAKEEKEAIKAACILQACGHMEQLEAELLLYKNALWKACGDEEEVVEATLESQR